MTNNKIGYAFAIFAALSSAATLAQSNQNANSGSQIYAQTRTRMITVVRSGEQIQCSMMSVNSSNQFGLVLDGHGQYGAIFSVVQRGGDLPLQLIANVAGYDVGLTERARLQRKAFSRIFFNPRYNEYFYYTSITQAEYRNLVSSRSISITESVAGSGPYNHVTAAVSTPPDEEAAALLHRCASS